MNNLIFLILGTIFGLLLSLAGATTFDFYAELFLLKNPQLARVISSAVIVGVIGIWLMKRVQAKALMTGEPIAFEKKGKQRGWIYGSLMFGAGWGITGSCPGSAPAMLGEGKFIIIPVIIGVIAGTYVYGWFESRRGRNCQ
ncbi:DUF6691 family protein [Sulfuriferula thiophila]|uniref:DUF6691 family protein n=1 Tax=Sulfuriferula thiophila TaxID=1781211 RepID=UPI000F60E065|nr:DUF6691 family protein [Sulfuriferula thiophila]